MQQIKDKNGETLTNDKEVIRRWEENIEELLEVEDNKIKQNNWEDVNKEHHKSNEIATAEIKDALKKPKNGRQRAMICFKYIWTNYGIQKKNQMNGKQQWCLHYTKTETSETEKL